MNDIVFETARLSVRRWSRSDFNALMAIYSDAEAMRWVGDGSPLTEDDCYRWIDVTERNYRTRGYGMFAVERRGVAGLIGCAGIVHPDGQPEPEVKYAYLRGVWGHGYATEALKGLLNYGRSHHNITQFIATVAPENTASRRVLENAAFTHVSTRTDDDGSTTLVYATHTDNDPLFVSALSKAD